MTKTEFKDCLIRKLGCSCEDAIDVTTLIEIIFDYGQGEEDDDPSDMYIKRLVANVDIDWGAHASRDIHDMIKRVYPHIKFPESLV